MYQFVELMIKYTYLILTLYFISLVANPDPNHVLNYSGLSSLVAD